MRLTEDILTQAELAAIERVADSNTPRFDELAKLADLDPENDFSYSDLRRLNFSGADLRGFDFTGSDLRQCVRNGNTTIDETTILTDAAVDWIELEALPIVLKMQEVESVSSSDARISVLNELTAEFGKTTHVVTYMVAAAAKSASLDEFIDFAFFLPETVTEGQADSLRQAASKLLRKKLSKSKSRTRRDTTTIFALEKIASRLKEGNGTLAAKIFSYLAEVVNAKHRTVQLGGMASLEQSDLEKAFARIGE